MGLVTDSTAIQFRILNRSKGPAMWSPRAQCDRAKFIWAWRTVLENQPNLNIWQDTVTEFLFSEDHSRVEGVLTQMGVRFLAKTVVLTAGTFLNGLMHIGRTMIAGGRCGELASYGLTEQLRTMGFETGRMKTGTPVRIDGKTIDFSLADRQDGDTDFHHFSYLPWSLVHASEVDRPAPQTRHASTDAAGKGINTKAGAAWCADHALPCYTIQTNEAVHEILRQGLPDSPLYNGQIQSIGPRYCPSIETKIVTFADKDHHLLFLEPEGNGTQEYYLNGFSSSLPIDIQMEALHQIPALSHAVAYRPGYAIEYDYFDPTQLRHTLETKLVSGLFFAGQVNGTTGYEEAAGQGLIAGANAALQVKGQEPFVLGRDEAYIGVLIDDLVTKGVDEPYRMFTSRAEYRILLRQDDADMRLTPRGYAVGLVDETRYRLMMEKKKCVEQIVEFCEMFHVKLSFNDTLASLGSSELKEGCKLLALVNRPELNLPLLAKHIPELAQLFASLPDDRRDEIIEAAEVQIKYEGYISREKAVAQKIARLEAIRLPKTINYDELQQLTIEARQKLSRIRPETIGQASRIPGVSPADVNILLVLLGR